MCCWGVGEGVYFGLKCGGEGGGWWVLGLWGWLISWLEGGGEAGGGGILRFWDG